MQGTSPEDISEILEKLHDSSLDLDEIIRDLNNILEIRKGAQLKMESVDLTHKLEKAKTVLKEQIEASKGIIEIDFMAGEKITGVNVYFESILYNLLSNAIKYRSPERPLRITVSTKKTKSAIEFIFSDNGIGIDLEKFSGKLFSLYQRFHTHVEGKGLGLFLVKTQVESMNGTIDVKSKVNVGTTFTLSFPLH